MKKMKKKNWKKKLGKSWKKVERVEKKLRKSLKKNWKKLKKKLEKLNFFQLFLVTSSLRSNVWSVSSLKSHSLCQNSKVAVTHWLTKARYRAARAAKKFTFSNSLFLQSKIWFQVTHWEKDVKGGKQPVFLFWVDCVLDFSAFLNGRRSVCGWKLLKAFWH